MKAKHVGWVSLAVLIAGGCSSTHPSRSAARSTTTPGAAPNSTARPSISVSSTTNTRVTTTTAPVSVAPPTTTGGSETSAAVRVVESHGYTPNDTGDYAYPDFRDGLHVIIASTTGSADGYTRRAFFFVHGRYIGTDLADPSAIVGIAWREDTTIALGYALYKPDDAMCCPLGGEATVRYHWTGTRLVALDPIPSLAARR